MSFRRSFASLVIVGIVLCQSGIFGVRVFDSIAIEISNKVITVNEIKLAVALQKQQFALQNQAAPDDKELKAAIVKSKIRDLLLESEAERLNVQVSQAELNDEINRYKQRIGKSEEDSLEDIFKNLNTTPSDFKTNVYRVILRNKILRAEIYSKINVSDEYLLTVFEKTRQENYLYTIRHILRRIPPAAEDEAKEKAKEDILYIIDKLKEDSSEWDTMVLTYSDDPSAKTNKGKLAPFQKDQVIKELADPVENMEIGEMIGPVETPFGFHVIELLDKTRASEADFEKAKEELYRKEQSSQYEKLLDAYIKGLRKKYIIRAVDPEYRQFVDQKNS